MEIDRRINNFSVVIRFSFNRDSIGRGINLKGIILSFEISFFSLLFFVFCRKN